jgi:hypothetical protein
MCCVFYLLTHTRRSTVTATRTITASPVATRQRLFQEERVGQVGEAHPIKFSQLLHSSGSQGGI